MFRVSRLCFTVCSLYSVCKLSLSTQMLHPYLPQINSKRHVILASASPRRKELLSKHLGVKFEVVESSFEELLPKDQYRGEQGAARYAVDTAKGKVLDVYQKVTKEPAVGRAPILIIGADTVVEHDGTIMEKAADAREAYGMLSKLSGSTHHVHTGVVLAIAQHQGEGATEPLLHMFSSTTTVEFDHLNDAMINAYIETGEPFGKAGSYGIQGIAGSFVRRIDGCFFNVVGFPVHKFASEMVALINQGKLQL